MYTVHAVIFRWRQLDWGSRRIGIGAMRLWSAARQLTKS